MAISKLRKDVLELGCYLVDEFGLAETCDTQGRWKAHYLAELIVAVNNCKNKIEKQSANKKVLELGLILCEKYNYSMKDLEKFIST